MKKRLFLCLLVLQSFLVSAETVLIDGIWYDLNAKTKEAEVSVPIDEIKYSGDISIPEAILYRGIEYRVSSIGVGAFADCKNLTSVTIPKSVSVIDVNTFYGCRKLSNVSIPNSITRIEAQAFEGCWALTDIKIPNSVEFIGIEAFWHCNELENITIGSSVKEIGVSAFGYCENLANVYIEDLGAWCQIIFVTNTSNPFFYAQHLYLNDEEVKDLIIPSTVTDIKDCAFYNCAFLANIIIPNSVTGIGNYAFEGCVNLDNVIIPNSVKEIGYCAFYGCEGLKSIIIPDSVTDIRSSTFSYCVNLTSITMPNAIKHIEDEAFSGCKNLIDVYCHMDKLPTTGNHIFLNSFTEYATLHVPANAIEKYKVSAPWSSFGNIIPLSNGDVSIEYPTNEMPIPSAIYNLSGQRVERCDKRGLYIINGKKRIIK